MITKFKKGDEVNMKSFPCTFKIKDVIKVPDGSVAYKLILVPPTPKDLTWLTLILRIQLVLDTDLTPTYQQKLKNRSKKVNQLLK